MTLFSNCLLASDHAGFELKEKVKSWIVSLRLFGSDNVMDLGPFSSNPSVDYPKYADLLAAKMGASDSFGLSGPQGVNQSQDMGVLICGSGIGMSIRANRYPLIRAALCWSAESARLAREHNNANVLCLSSRLIEDNLNQEILRTFVQSAFEGGRHETRVNQLGQALGGNFEPNRQK